MNSMFIKIGTINLKKNNIKEFGIATKVVENYTKGQSLWSAIKGKFFGKEVRYLFVKTFQNENYTFEEHEIDIDKVEALLRAN